MKVVLGPVESDGEGPIESFARHAAFEQTRARSTSFVQ
jgi:hypothetical protein